MAKKFEAIPSVAQAMVDGYGVAKERYNLFATIQGVKLLDGYTMEDFTTDEGSIFISTAQEYATYLLEFTQTNGTHLKPGTMVQYLSGWKSSLAKKFPKATLLKEKHPDSIWYDDLYVSDTQSALYYLLIFLFSTPCTQEQPLSVSVEVTR